jgi:hypothetical protein
LPDENNLGKNLFSFGRMEREKEPIFWPKKEKKVAKGGVLSFYKPEITFL